MNRKLSPAWTLAILTGLNLFNYMDRAVLGAVRTPLADEFHIGFTDSGRAFTAFMIGYFITSPIFGWLGDRVARKWLIASGILIWSAGTMLTGFAATFSLLLAYRVLVGVGEASYATISPGMISDTFSPKKRNMALSIFFAAIPVGYAAGYLFGGQMATHFGWRHAFIWAGAPGLALALVLIPFRDPERGGAETGSIHTQKPKLPDLLKLFRNGPFMLVVWGYVAYTFALGAFSFWGPTFFEKLHGMTTADANTFFGLVIVVTGLVGTMLGGWLGTLWQKRSPAGYAWLSAISILLSVPTCVLALAVPGRLAAMTLLAVAIFLLFLSTGPVNTLILETVPANVRASAMALSIFLIHLCGDMWSSEVVGILADSWKNLRSALMILPVALAVGTIFWLLLALKQQRSGRESAAA